MRDADAWSTIVDMNDDHDNDLSLPEEEIGSDELLAADDLRLPADANILVRLHAMRAWLGRRYEESGLDVGGAALDVQEIARATEHLTRSRRHAGPGPPHAAGPAPTRRRSCWLRRG